jgi:stage III sporulation protein AF
MEIIRQLVRSLAFLAILSAFLEMLLPLQGTRRFVQVIIGLFIMLAVLGPIVTLLRQQPPLHFTMSVNDESGGVDLSKILEQGQSMQAVTSAQEQAAYVQRLDDQIEVMCRIVPGVTGAKATVSLSPDASLKSLGTVQKVAIELQSSSSQAVSQEEPVKTGSALNAASGFTASQQEIADQVRETVASLFGLQKEQVSVNFIADPYAAKGGAIENENGYAGNSYP